MFILKLCNNIHYLPVYHSYYYITSCQKSTIHMYIYIYDIIAMISEAPHSTSWSCRGTIRTRDRCVGHIFIVLTKVHGLEVSPTAQWRVESETKKGWGKWWEKKGVAGWFQPIWKQILIRVNHTYRELVCVYEYVLFLNVWPPNWLCRWVILIFETWQLKIHLNSLAPQCLPIPAPPPLLDGKKLPENMGSSSYL